MPRRTRSPGHVACTHCGAWLLEASLRDHYKTAGCTFAQRSRECERRGYVRVDTREYYFRNGILRGSDIIGGLGVEDLWRPETRNGRCARRTYAPPWVVACAVWASAVDGGATRFNSVAWAQAFSLATRVVGRHAGLRATLTAAMAFGDALAAALVADALRDAP